MFTVFKVANVITATVGGCVGGGGVFASALALESKPTIFGSTFAPDALETEADAFGEGGAVFSIIPPAH